MICPPCSPPCRSRPSRSTAARLARGPLDATSSLLRGEGFKRLLVCRATAAATVALLRCAASPYSSGCSEATPLLDLAVQAWLLGAVVQRYQRLSAAVCVTYVARALPVHLAPVRSFSPCLCSFERALPPGEVECLILGSPPPRHPRGSRPSHRPSSPPSASPIAPRRCSGCWRPPASNPAIALDNEARLRYNRLLRFELVEEASDACVRANPRETRFSATAAAAVLGALRHDTRPLASGAALSDALAFIAARRHEVEDVRCAMLNSLAGIPPAYFGASAGVGCCCVLCL